MSALHNPVTRVAAVHDLSSFGRTSLTVVIPIFSAMGIQVCPLPTAVLSTSTSGFENFRFVDLTDAMRSFLDHWVELGLDFTAIYSGFLGSPDQVNLVIRCIDHCLKPGGIVVVDPVLGDNGELEPTMDMAMVGHMRNLVAKADCITPNLTEAALLLDEPYPAQSTDKGMDLGVCKSWLRRLSDLGPEIVVITSVPTGDGRNTSAVLAYQRSENRFWKVDCEYIPAHFPGTGDTFTSVLTGSLLRGDSLPLAMDRAVQFVTLGIRATFGHRLPYREGILLERVLRTLDGPATTCSYAILED